MSTFFSIFFNFFLQKMLKLIGDFRSFYQAVVRYSEKNFPAAIFFVALSDCIAMLSDNEHKNPSTKHHADQTGNHRNLALCGQGHSVLALQRLWKTRLSLCT